MRGYEFRSTLDPESHLHDVLHARPPIPSGRVDLDSLRRELQDVEAGEPGYAWERLPYWLVDLKEVYESLNSEDSIVTLDIGSSVPLYAQLLRSREFFYSGYNARELSRSLFSAEAIAQLRQDNQELVSIATRLAREKETRAFLVAALQECLYEITPSESAGDSKRNTLFRERLFKKLLNQKCVYTQDDNGRDVEAAWGLRFKAIESEASYFEQISQFSIPNEASRKSRHLLARERELALYHRSQMVIPGLIDEGLDYENLAKQTRLVESELATQYIFWQARFLADIIVGDPRYKSFRHLSMDFADPRQIAASALVNTPEVTKKLNLFSHAIASLQDSSQHLQGNLFEGLPFPQNSIALITCFDAWPFHFQTEGDLKGEQEIREAIISTLLELYDKLAYGGKVVIFPWATSKSGKDREVDKCFLEGILEELSRRINHEVSRYIAPIDVMQSWMSSSDKETSRSLSSVFTAADKSLETLVITKK